ncbi:MAG TPA: hypothetical protein ENJ95_15805 [Bacteroidetes bacterium]|nr:hypothetical protein [Bacteroidota bacterium]
MIAKYIIRLLFLIAPFCLHAQEAAIIPKTGQPPLIDAQLTDGAWQEAGLFTGFKTIQPDYGLPPSEKTEVLLTYDSEFFYVGIRCYDREPGKIKSTVSKRDQVSGDDWVAFCLDAFNDELGAFFFLAKPNGIQADGTLDANANPDILLDMVWESAGQLTADGYVVEMAIPFRSLRFPKGETLTMGFKVARFISRKSEEVDFPGYRPGRGANLAQFQKIELSGIQRGRSFELLPAFTLDKKSTHKNGEMGGGKWDTAPSLTAKMGITSGLTLDATYKPDFSQVETDAGQIDVNLRASVFYPEKRPFFLEGQQWYGFGARPEGSPLREIINTRNIVDPLLGVKLSGKLGKSNMISTLYALDEFPGQSEGAPSGKKAQVGLLRYGRILKNDSYLGASFTGRSFGDKDNYVGGADGRLRSGNRSSFEFHGFGSQSRGEGFSGGRSGHAAGLGWFFNSRKLEIGLGAYDVSKGFQTDLGYLRRQGLLSFITSADYNFFFSQSPLQRLSPYFWGRCQRDHFDEKWECLNVLGTELAFPRQTEISLEAWLGNEVFAGQLFSRNAWSIEARSQITNFLSFGLDIFHGKLIYYDPASPFQGRGTFAGLDISLQPTGSIKSGFSLSHASFFRKGGGKKIYGVNIFRNRTTFQFNKYLFFRTVLEFNAFNKRLQADLLLSFTYIPGTVVYLGYGSIFEKTEWQNREYIRADKFLNTQRNLFFKASYLWRF